MNKGRYVCQIEVDFTIPEKYSMLKDRIVNGWIEEILECKVADIFEHGNPKVTVTRQYADIVQERWGQE